MPYVYVLKSLKNGKRYIGSTELKPEARQRENFLKSGIGRKFLDELLK